MRIALIFLMVVHGLIHLMGFVKAFGFTEIRTLTEEISRPSGIAWLVCADLWLIFALSHVIRIPGAGYFGLMALLLSQALISLHWKDARFGTLANVVLLMPVLLSFGRARFEARADRETRWMFTEIQRSLSSFSSMASADSLPAPVLRWLRASGVMDRTLPLTVQMTQDLKLKMKPGQKVWYQAKASQVTSLNPPGFHWAVDAELNPFIGFLGRDQLVGGEGEMLICFNGLFKVVHARGPQIDEGTLQRFLGEMVWLPTLAMSPIVRWEPIDELSARATIHLGDSSASGTFYFDERGDFVRFSAMRFLESKPGASRYPWILDAISYKRFDGIRIPFRVTATWKLEGEDWNWLELELTNVKYGSSGEEF
ncbi:MAG: hypothetical protein KBF37_02760 [Saprospiraceae bacterium]|jgi:hypothetical protein|nr:hypothetical protein [Saprospiraceae bacterium]MBP9209220.1 hypothetical protein [Saprospiraceae bacterium]MBV6472997.1 hypothetical protein [Saprospiraceae bacterium]